MENMSIDTFKMILSINIDYRLKIHYINFCMLGYLRARQHIFNNDKYMILLLKKKIFKFLENVDTNNINNKINFDAVKSVYKLGRIIGENNR